MTIRDGAIDISNLLKAYEAFSKGMAVVNPDDLSRDGIIQRFEFTFELTWKVLKRLIEADSIKLGGPRDVIREAAKLGIIEDPKLWFKFLEDRNSTVHTYNEDRAQMIYSRLPRFKKELDRVIKVIKTK